MHSKTGQYFNALKAHGEDVSFTLVRLRGEKPLERLRYDHRLYDGVTAICELARRLPAEGFSAPQLPLTPKPGPLGLFLRLAVWWLRLFPGVGQSWRTGTGEKKAVSACLQLSSSQWRALQERGLGGLSHLLAALDHTARAHLIVGPWPRLWMVPVGLHPRITRETPAHNSVAFVDVRLWSEGTQAAISRQLKRDLKQGIYWGSRLTLHVALLFGEKVFRLVLPSLPRVFRRTGTLTHLGAWRFSGVAEDEWWVIEATTAELSPVAASVLEVNGKLGLAVQFHASLRWSEPEARVFVRRWKERLLSQGQELL